MGQKVNPHGMRVGVIKDWDSRWYASNEKVGDLLVEDHKIRVYLKKLLFAAGVSKIEIERSNEVVTIYLHVARPGVVIGKGGEQIEQYRKDVEKLIGKTVKLNIVEVRNPDMDAQLVAENIAAQLEKRISHRRAMKNAMGRAMRAGAKGIKCNCGGRLGGREIAGSVQQLLQVDADLVVLDQQVADLLVTGIPAGIPVLDDAHTHTMGIDFLTHLTVPPFLSLSRRRPASRERFSC